MHAYHTFQQDETPQQRRTGVVRKVTLEDETSKTTMQLALWGKKGTSPAKIGDKIKARSVRVVKNTLLKQLSLSSTSLSEIQVRNTNL